MRDGPYTNLGNVPSMTRLGVEKNLSMITSVEVYYLRRFSPILLEFQCIFIIVPITNWVRQVHVSVTRIDQTMFKVNSLTLVESFCLRVILREQGPELGP